jgi:benzoylformate decarboxylase
MLHDLLPLQPGRYLTAASGSLGFGLPAAAGAALAAPGRPVVALIGDGSSHYGLPGLWTAARHALPITYVIVDNSGYGAMRSFAQLHGSKRSPDFSIEGVDYCALAACRRVASRCRPTLPRRCAPRFASAVRRWSTSSSTPVHAICSDFRHVVMSA